MNPNVFVRFSEETNNCDITSYKFEQSIQPSVRVNILASSGSNTFATVARITLEQTLSKNMVAKDEPVSLQLRILQEDCARPNTSMTKL